VSDTATILRVAADCLAVSAWLPSEADLGREYLAAALAELPAAYADRINTAPNNWRLLDRIADELEPPKRKRMRKPCKPRLAAALKEARKAGASVKGATIESDRRLSLQFGEPDAAEPATDFDKWMAKHAREIERH
jgi:hypothetical protein